MKTSPAQDFSFDIDAMEAFATAHVQSLVNKDAPKTLTSCFHKHKRGQLAFPISGSCICYTKDKVWTLMPDQAFWMPAGIPHRIFHSEGASSGYLYLDCDTWSGFNQVCSVQLPMYALHGLMHIAESDQTKPLPRQKERLLKLIIEEVMNSQARPMFGLAVPKDERIKHVNSYILENPSEKVSLQDWADFFHISSKTFNRLVVKETGVTFQQWKNQLLVMNAIELMSKDRTIGWIASELGYGSTSAFSAMFRREMGLSPQEYRKQVLRRC